ncbi:MAG TPA: hypothetical protein VL633_08400 [Bacteroidota bacterium]|nr:hypothetical protein [Bacteroidota bacterium]
MDQKKHTGTFSNIGVTVPQVKPAGSVDPQQVLTKINFGRVDGESDTRFDNCFIGTEMLRQVLLPQHTLVVGSKGAGKSAMCRLLCEDINKVGPLLPKEFEEVFCIPAYGLQTEEYLSGIEIRELKPKTADDFRYFWLLYIGLKAAGSLTQDPRMLAMLSKSKDEKAKQAFETLKALVIDFGLAPKEKGMFSKFKEKVGMRSKPSASSDPATAADFKQRTGMSVIALIENIDILLRETKSVAWIMLDKLDLLFIEDFERLKGAITGLIQLLVQYGNQFTNVHFKIFIRNDIYRQLHIVNKSHLITYTTEMKWRGPLLLKLLVSRAIIDPHVRAYCEEILNEKVDVTSVILNDDGYVKKVFYALFEPTMSQSANAAGTASANATPTHQWILKRLVDGLGNSFPREIIHLGNMAAEKQREINRAEGRHDSTRLISPKALKDAFQKMSAYRCDTYLYAEFPHLAKHFDVFRGSDSATFHREELYMLFEPLSPKGDEAIRAVHDVGLLIPVGKNVDSCSEFKVPLLYRAGLGVTERRPRPQSSQRSEGSSGDMVNVEEAGL